MGIHATHPFFGNQYTNGGYIPGSFKFPEIVETVVESSSKLIPNNINVSATRLAKGKKILRLKPSTRVVNKNILIATGIGMGLVMGGYFTYRHFSKKKKAKQEALCSIELRNVGICTHCGEPLIGSTYIPENEECGHNAYILCKKCGEKNFAWYPDDKNGQGQGE